MKECDIFRGSKHNMTPPTYFQGSRHQTPGTTPLCLGVSRAPTATALPNFGGFPFYFYVHPVTQHYQIWRCYTYGEGVVFKGQPRRNPQGDGAPALPSFDYTL